MFKATNKQRNEEVVILDPKWSSQLHYLRQLDRNDELVCTGCQQPVRVRAGQERRWHFAHKGPAGAFERKVTVMIFYQRE